MNHRPSDYEPDELTRLLYPARNTIKCIDFNGGRWGIRTPAQIALPFGFQDRSLQPGLGNLPILLLYHIFLMVLLTGLEPVTDRLWVGGSNQLSYRSFWWLDRDSNSGPIGYEPITLTNWAIQPWMVGKTGFEPATPWSQTKCTTKLCYFPKWRSLKDSNP